MPSPLPYISFLLSIYVSIKHPASRRYHKHCVVSAAVYAFCFVVLHTFADLCFALPEVISVNPNKPECNGPFLIFRVPNFDGAKDGTEFKGFYIMLEINKDFLEIDDSTNYFSANVTGSKHILFRMPAFPYAFWPWLKGNVGEEFMKIIQDQVSEPVQKAMSHAYSVFAPDDSDTTAQSWRRLVIASGSTTCWTLVVSMTVGSSRRNSCLLMQGTERFLTWM
jgi:hypothetical protein